MKNIRVLVTGCGGDIGQSVGKILKEAPFVSELFGCDISDRNAGRFIFSNFSVGLACSDPGYLSYLESFVFENNIELIIPISEPELRFFSANKITEIGGSKLLMASSEAMSIGFDKLRTAGFLEREGLPFPKTSPLTDFVPNGYPVVVKSRTGSGSSSVHIVNDDEELRFLKGRNSDCIAQEYLDGSLGEYTCCVFRDRSGEIRTIIFKRELHGGFSGYGEVITNESISSLLIVLATRLELRGSINVQLRLTAKGPVIFEINPRFSSTVLFRDMLGFRDVIWSIEDEMFDGISGYMEGNTGKKFYKGFSEYIG